MSLSPTLAELNFERYQDWQRPFTPDNARQALLAFNGDVYDGMNANEDFDAGDFERAQATLRILSGLYGVLRPLDLMMPYRLEMGTKLPNDEGKDLYAFWTATVTESLRHDLGESPGDDVLVNLASQEYFGAVDESALDAPVVSPAFYDAKGDADFKIISFWAKKARGAMAAWMIKNKVTSAGDLSGFDAMGYGFSEERSSEDRPVFTRRHDE